jgi:hypothetical protein
MAVHSDYTGGAHAPYRHELTLPFKAVMVSGVRVDLHLNEQQQVLLYHDGRYLGFIQPEWFFPADERTRIRIVQETYCRLTQITFDLGPGALPV